MMDIVTKYYNIICSILKSLNTTDVATEWQQWNLRSAIKYILEPVGLDSSTIDKIEAWVIRILDMIRIGLAIAAPLVQLYGFFMNAPGPSILPQ